MSNWDNYDKILINYIYKKYKIALRSTPSENPSHEIEEIKIWDVEQDTFSPEEIQEYKEVLITMEQAERLREWRITIEEISRIWREQLWSEVESINQVEQNQERLNNMTRESVERRQWELEEAEESITQRLADAWSRASEQVREQASEVRNHVENASWVSSFINWLESAKQKWWIMWFFASIVLWITWMLWLNKANEAINEAEQAAEQAEEALNEQNIEQTKQTTKDTINESLWDYITDDNREKLNEAIDWLSEEQVRQLYHSIESWDFSIKDIERIVPNLFTDILDEAQIENIRTEIETTIIEKLSTSIKEEYGIDVEMDDKKRQDLENLVKENLELSDERIMEIREIVEKREFRYSDLSEVGWEVMFNSVNVMFWLISKWIVPMSNFTFNFVEASWKMIAIWAGALWINENISFENFQQKIEDMNESEKAMFVWMLYRKWGLFLSLVSNISEQVSRSAISMVTNTTVSSSSLISASVMNNFEKQANNIDRIARALDPSNLTDHRDILRAATDNLAKVRENYVMMDLIQQVDWDDANKYRQLKRLLSEKNISIPSHSENFDDLLRVLWEKNNISSAASNRWSITSRIGFWANAELNRLNRKLETISNAQKRMFNPNFLTGWLSKIREAINIPEISRMWDRLSFHFNSPSQARDALRRLNTLANRFPELLKWTIDKAPIIMVAWIAANSEEWVIESLKEQVPYLIPLVWPVMILMNSWWTWKDWIPKPIDPMNVWIWTALITVDWAILWREAIRSWWRWVWWYMMKPFMDVYSMGRWVADIGYSATRTVARWWIRSWLSHFWREAIRRVRNVPGWSRVRAMALIWVVGYIWINQLLKDWEQIEWIEDLMTNWELDMDRINEAAWELTDWQKEEAVSLILEDDWIEWLQIRVISNRMFIKSNNPRFQSDYFIHDYNLFELLKLDPDYDFEYTQNA